MLIFFTSFLCLIVFGKVKLIFLALIAVNLLRCFLEIISLSLVPVTIFYIMLRDPENRNHQRKVEKEK